MSVRRKGGVDPAFDHHRERGAVGERQAGQFAVEPPEESQRSPEAFRVNALDGEIASLLEQDQAVRETKRLGMPGACTDARQRFVENVVGCHRASTVLPEGARNFLCDRVALVIPVGQGPPGPGVPEDLPHRSS
jgi:hypothetical protein